jgi:hypothetical protein
MMSYYSITFTLVLLLALGWLLRKPLASRGVKLFIRILVGVFAVAGAAAWTMLLLALVQLGKSLVGAGDGAGTGRGSDPPGILLLAVVWLVPVTGFMVMLLGVFNVLRGVWRRIGYWYALIFLVIATVALLIAYPGIPALRWVGLVFMLVAMFWGYAFRGKSAGQ